MSAIDNVTIIKLKYFEWHYVGLLHISYPLVMMHNICEAQTAVLQTVEDIQDSTVTVSVLQIELDIVS